MNTFLSRRCGAGGGLLMSLMTLFAAATTGNAQSVTIDLVSVGYASNAADSTGLGSVNYQYQIGKYEVTNSQYAAFLNAAAKTDSYGLYDPAMAGQFGGIVQNGSQGSFSYSVKPGHEQQPVRQVSFLDAARFTNWLSNGQGNGKYGDGSLYPGGFWGY